MNVTKMIGLAGPLEGGKDTVASHLRGYAYHHISVGRHIRKEVEMGYLPPGVLIPDTVRRTLLMLRESVTRRELVWSKPTTPEIRETLQWYGEWRYSVNARYWTSKIRDEIRALPDVGDMGGRIVISDIRRPNEFHLVHEFRGENWRIERIVSEDNPARAHVTETALAHYDFDAYIDNTQTLDRMRNCVDECIRVYDPEMYAKVNHDSSSPRT